MFHPFNWIVEFACIALQTFLFYKLEEPKSLRYLMVFLCALNCACMLTRNHPDLYWDILWTGRAIGMCWFLWAVADLCNMDQKCHIIWRVPALGNAIVFLWYEPYSLWSSVQDMETFMAFGLWLALIMVLFDLIFVGLHSRYFHVLSGLAVFLSLEVAAAVLEINFPHSKYPLMASVLGLAGWVTILCLPGESGGVRSPLPVPQL